MKKYAFTQPIVNLVVGIVLIVLAVLAMFVFDWISDFARYLVGAIIIVYTILRFFTAKNSYKDSNARMILIVEAIIAIVLAVLLIVNEIGMQLALGATIYMRGFVYLLILQLLNLRRNFQTFLIYIVILTLGAYVWFGNADLTIIEWLVFVFITAVGVFLAIMGFTQLKK